MAACNGPRGVRPSLMREKSLRPSRAIQYADPSSPKSSPQPPARKQGPQAFQPDLRIVSGTFFMSGKNASGLLDERKTRLAATTVDTEIDSHGDPPWG